MIDRALHQSNVRWQSKIRLSRMFLFLTMVIITGSSLTAPSYAASTIYATNQWNPSLDSAIHADDSQSVVLPDGKILWTFGDTIQVNGASTVSGYGYPHDAFVLQTPHTLRFTPVSGKYGYGWMQVPNWSDGSYFWMATPIVDGNNLYVLGQRITGNAPFQVTGQYVAVFNVSTLAFERIVAIPGGVTGQTNWGGITKTSTGWWITGTHNVSCSYATDCKSGDMAFVSFGNIATPSEWHVYNSVIPATDNLGTTLAMVKTPTRWDIFTKTGDAYGGTTIERLTASSPTANWTVSASWPASAPTGTVSYGVSTHPEQSAPSGYILVSYNVNNFKSICWPLFMYLPE